MKEVGDHSANVISTSSMSMTSTVYFADESDWDFIKEAAALDEIPPTVLLRNLAMAYAKKRVARSGVCPECGQKTQRAKKKAA